MSKILRSVSVLLAVSASALLLTPACERFSGCAKTGTCPSDEGGGGSGGDATGGGGGSTSLGGSGTGGAADPCDACDGATPFCDDAKECVECLETTDCDDPTKSVCDEGACVGCEENADCAHIAGTEVCDTEASLCVECTDASDCGGNPCNPITHTCSAFGTDRRTCESCDTDENCNTPNNFCVPMQYEGGDRPGGYCLKTAPDCAQPFGSLIAGRTTLSGMTGQNYCGINEANATCEAVRALLDNVACPGGTDAECPESGVCRDIGGTLSDRCTYRCVDASECTESGAKSTCGDAPNDFCGYVP